jgi:trans-AT polyketide synthase, acyltransferase and oxidoreductase domains
VVAPNTASLGTWRSGRYVPAFVRDDLRHAVGWLREPVFVVREAEAGRLGVARGGSLIHPDEVNGVPTFPMVAQLPPIYPEWLGDRSFNEVHGVRFPYVVGAMANGIATTDMVIAMARAEMLAFFGAAGLSPARIARELDVLEAALGHDGPAWGSNLIHAPNEPAIEAETVDLYIRRRVRRVSASAYMGLNPMVVRYAAHGLHRNSDGSIGRKNHLFAKISRPEVARHFLKPAPAAMLDELVRQGKLTVEEGELARRVPVAEDYTVEADSGGHTDNQALPALFPTIARLRDDIAAQYGYQRPIRLGAAGGLGTPSAVASAFALGAAFVLTGSVNQSAVESGLSPKGKELLCKAGLADVVMAPAADMFELGVKVQVLQRGTMFGVRAHKLYDLYKNYEGLHALPADVKANLEQRILGASVEEVWSHTEAFFAERDPAENERAARDPKHKMALVFRWYLGLSSRWAIAGQGDRAMDYQIWCGPAMGAFNAWVAGTELEHPENRTVVQIAKNLLEGAAIVTRAQQLRSFGVPVPRDVFTVRPRRLV